MDVEVWGGSDRFVSRADGVVSRHSFSYGPHYDPTNTRLGALVAHNDDTLAPGAGFPDHPHRDLEIVTWVISGALRHTDSTGGSGVVRAGMAARLSTGKGVRHSEANAFDSETRYVQMWLLPDEKEVDEPARYDVADVSVGLAGGEFIVVASGDRPAPLTLRRAGASFLVAQLPAGEVAALPPAALLHVFVATGTATLTAGVAPTALVAGDAVRLTGVAGAGIAATTAAEILAWALGTPRRLNGS